MRSRLRALYGPMAALLSLAAWVAVPQSALAHGIHIAGSQNELVAILFPVLIFIVVTGTGVLLVLLYYRRDPGTEEEGR